MFSFNESLFCNKLLLNRIISLIALFFYILSILYFSGFDLINPSVKTWESPPQPNKQKRPLTFNDFEAKFPYILTPPSLWYLLKQVHLTTLNKSGSGSTIAFIEKSTNINIDWVGINAFCKQFNLPKIDYIKTLEGKIKNHPDNKTNEFDQEETLDIEWAHAIAPKAVIAVVHSSNNFSLFKWEDLIKKLYIIKPTVVSVSTENINQQAMFLLRIFSLLGQKQLSSVPTFVAVGDGGPAATFPGMLPYVISVGGLNIGEIFHKTNKVATYSVSETLVNSTGWNGTAGGIAWLTYNKPKNQDGFNKSFWRGTPDISWLLAVLYG